jgi:mRNA-degrading endonuclease RelE of RelBE toxin-antitoxin system
MYTAFYFDEVKDDVRVAKTWYREQQYGLDKRFELSLKETIANILKMPSAYAIRYKKVRIAHTKIFPYNIHFYIDEAKKQIVIIGIVHNKRGDAIFLDR